MGVRVTGPVAMMAIMRPLIRPLTPVDIAAVVEFSLRAWAPVFESFRTVLGERVYQALYPDWSMTQARAVEAVHKDDTAKVWVAEQLGRPVGYVAVRIHRRCCIERSPRPAASTRPPKQSRLWARSRVPSRFLVPPVGEPPHRPA